MGVRRQKIVNLQCGTNKVANQEVSLQNKDMKTLSLESNIKFKKSSRVRDSC